MTFNIVGLALIAIIVTAFATLDCVYWIFKYVKDEGPYWSVVFSMLAILFGLVAIHSAWQLI